MLGSQLQCVAAKTHQIQSQGSYSSKRFWGGMSRTVSFAHICLLSPKVSTPQQNLLSETLIVVQYLYVLARAQRKEGGNVKSMTTSKASDGIPMTTSEELRLGKEGGPLPFAPLASRCPVFTYSCIHSRVYVATFAHVHIHRACTLPMFLICVHTTQWFVYCVCVHASLCVCSPVCMITNKAPERRLLKTRRVPFEV